MRHFINIVEAALKTPAQGFEREVRALADRLGVVIDIARHHDDEVSLENLNVPADRRGTGLGNQFISKLVDCASKHAVMVHVQPTPYEGGIEPDALRSFYTKHGFVVDPDDDGYLMIDCRAESITEARRNPTVNKKTSTVDSLEKYKGRKDVFVTYTANVGVGSHPIRDAAHADRFNPTPKGKAHNISGHKVGINPRSEYNTPIGIYTYPIDYVIQKGNKVEFANHEPFIQVLQIKPSANIWYLQEGDRSAWEILYQIVYGTLRSKYGSEPKIEDFYSRYSDKSEAEKKFDDALFDYEIFDETDHPKLRTLLTRELRNRGYDGVADMNGLGIIHDNEPTQAVFFTTSAFKHIETIYNRS